MNTQTTQKFLIIILLITINTLILKSQTTDDFGRITLKVQIPDTSVPQEAKALLETKIKQMITHFGIASSDMNSRFVMEAKVNILSKDIVPGPPQMISQKVEIAFFVGDAIKQKVFSSTSNTYIGVGTNETKSFMAAIRQINPKNESYKSLIDEGKTEIIAYYQADCEMILKEAEASASKGEYDRAIYHLALIPDVCADCYQRSLKLQGELFTKKIETEGKAAFLQAKAIWAESPNSEGASRVARVLPKINPQVSFIREVNQFAKEVSAVVQAQELREWQQQVKEYNDRVEAAKKRADRNYQLEQMRIKAYRDVAVEYARNQPRTIYRTLVIW